MAAERHLRRRRWSAPTTSPPTEIHDKVRRNEGAPWFAVSPLMHAAGLWTVFSGASGRPAGGACTTTGRSSTRPPVLADRRAGEGRHDDDGRRRLRGPAGRGAQRQRSYELSSLFAIGTGGAATNPKHSTRAAGVAAAAHHHQRLRLVGDRQHGLRSQPARVAPRDTFELREGGTGGVRGLHPVPASPASTEVGWVARDGPDSAWATSTMPTPPARHSPWSTGQRVVISGDRGVAGGRRHAAAVRPRLTGGQHRRGEGVRRGGRGGTAGAPGDRRRAGGRPAKRAVGPGDRRAGGAARRSRRRPTSRCTRTAHQQLARFKAPKEFIFVEQVRRLGNGKADYRWAKSEATQQESLT